MTPLPLRGTTRETIEEETYWSVPRICTYCHPTAQYIKRMPPSQRRLKPTRRRRRHCTLRFVAHLIGKQAMHKLVSFANAHICVANCDAIPLIRITGPLYSVLINVRYKLKTVLILSCCQHMPRRYVGLINYNVRNLVEHVNEYS